jgi:hypothetical protein
MSFEIANDARVVNSGHRSDSADQGAEGAVMLQLELRSMVGAASCLRKRDDGHDIRARSHHSAPFAYSA